MRRQIYARILLCLKFIHSEKATKFCEIFILLLTLTTYDKSKVKILQNFVAFSEYMNFNGWEKFFKALQEKIRVLEKPEWNWFFQSHNAIFLSNLGAQVSFSIVLSKIFAIFVGISNCSFQTNIT